MEALKGTWKNELGSTMIIQDVSEVTFRGTYKTKVSSSGKSLTEPVFGAYRDCGNGILTVTFSVHWRQETDDGVKFSATSWTGTLKGGKIETTWILKSADKADWTAYTVNKDSFTKE